MTDMNTNSRLNLKQAPRIKSRAFLVLAAIVLLGGCLDYEDHLTIESDGSAEHRVVMGQSLELESMFEDMAPSDADAEVEESPDDLSEDFRGDGVDIVSERTYTEKRQNAQGEEVEYEFQEVVARYDSLNDSPYFADNTGEVEFEQTDNGHYFRRTLRQDALGEEDQDPQEAAQSAQFINMLFPDAVLRFVVDMPDTVSSANLEGAPGSVEPEVDGRRVVVEIPFVDAMMMTEDLVMEIESR